MLLVARRLRMQQLAPARKASTWSPFTSKYENIACPSTRYTLDERNSLYDLTGAFVGSTSFTQFMSSSVTFFFSASAAEGAPEGAPRPFADATL